MKICDNLKEQLTKKKEMINIDIDTAQSVQNTDCDDVFIDWNMCIDILNKSLSCIGGNLY